MTSRKEDRMIRLAVFFGMSIIASSAFAETTEEMLSECKSVAEAEVTEGNVHLPEDFSSGACWGAFAAVQSVIWWRTSITTTKK